METLALAQTAGYYTGGTVHVVINNQIGFTTSDPRDSRSTLYCTDVVKMIEAPVLHVNGDDAEAVVLASRLALDYRQDFNKDVVVDIVCFRKLGHNEQDTPALTQPLMYKKIARHPGTRKLYGDKLVAQGVVPAEGPDEMVKALRAAMDAGKSTYDPVLTNYKSKYAVDWAPFLGRKWTDAADTALAARRDQAAGRTRDDAPAELQGAPAGREGPRRPRRDGPRRDPRRLGHGRAPRVRIAGRERLLRAAFGRRLGTRHLHAPALGAARPEPRESGTKAPTRRCSMCRRARRLSW
jgi:2-oxoglutarate dehydrogenase E1 component